MSAPSEAAVQLGPKAAHSYSARTATSLTGQQRVVFSNHRRLGRSALALAPGRVRSFLTTLFTNSFDPDSPGYSSLISSAGSKSILIYPPLDITAGLRFCGSGASHGRTLSAQHISYPYRCPSRYRRRGVKDAVGRALSYLRSASVVVLCHSFCTTTTPHISRAALQQVRYIRCHTRLLSHHYSHHAA